jgi:hypothetical protein
VLSTTWSFPPGSTPDRPDSPDRFDICYGMADDRIGVARLDLTETLPGRVKQSNQAEV